jgi:protein-L-isoaspartate(D-aspartate) O-methyltransferase
VVGRGQPPDSSTFEAERQQMVAQDLRPRGIDDQAVLDAMGSVRREAFVPEDERRNAYRDRPLPIGARQTISQPFIVALMAEAAEVGPDDSVLEIGTGSGYGAAVLAALARHVVTIERHASLAADATAALQSEGIDNVEVVVGDGTDGRPETAPYDAIVVTAAGPEVPAALLEQLAPGGRLIMPVGAFDGPQNLIRVRRHADGLRRDDLGPVRFVPLIADQ